MRSLVTIGALIAIACQAAPVPSLTGPPSAVPTQSPAPPIESPSLTPVLSGSPTPTSGLQQAPVIARVEIPFPDAQAVGDGAVAVLGDSIWIADGSQSHLVRINALTNQVLAAIEVEPSSLIAGDGALWTISPVGLVPGPDRLTVSRVDLELNRVIPTTYPEIGAAGMGSLWSVSQDRGLERIAPDNGEVTGTWPQIRGSGVQTGCGTVWVSDSEKLTRIDPDSGAPTAVIDTSHGGGRVHETSTGCYVLTYDGEGRGLIVQIDQSGGINQSLPIDVTGSPLDVPIQIAGDTVWKSTDGRLIQQIDPLTAAAIGQPWLLPAKDIPTNPKFIDWQLVSAGADLWLLTAAAITHLDMPTVPPSPTP